MNTVSTGVKAFRDIVSGRSVLLLAAVSLIPHLLSLVGDAAFAAMLSTYICFPAGMGVFSLIHLRVLNYFSFTSPVTWGSAIVFSLLWTVPLRWLWMRDNRLTVTVVYVASLTVSSWLLWTRVMPPT